MLDINITGVRGTILEYKYCGIYLMLSTTTITGMFMNNQLYNKYITKFALSAWAYAFIE